MLAATFLLGACGADSSDAIDVDEPAPTDELLRLRTEQCVAGVRAIV